VRSEGTSIRLHTGLGSGNSYKVERFLNLLSVPYAPVPVSIPKGEHLTGRHWLATEETTIADIACYPYLLLAAEGGVDTAPFGRVTAWMRRLESLPGFWPMPRIPNLPPVPLVPYAQPGA
jgi:glutathione S-transferase